jgi:hypothetical protein
MKLLSGRMDGFWAIWEGTDGGSFARRANPALERGENFADAGMEPISNLSLRREGKLSGAGGSRPFSLAIHHQKNLWAKKNFSNQSIAPLREQLAKALMRLAIDL